MQYPYRSVMGAVMGPGSPISRPGEQLLQLSRESSPVSAWRHAVAFVYDVSVVAVDCDRPGVSAKGQQPLL